MSEKYEVVDKQFLKVIGEDGTLKGVVIRKDIENRKASIIREMAESDSRYKEDRTRKQADLDKVTTQLEAFDA